MTQVVGSVTGANKTAVSGTSVGGVGTVGVHGKGQAIGVIGEGQTWHGVAGFSASTTGGFGVYGVNTAGGTGVVGESKTWMGVYGRSESTTGGAGVMAESVGTRAALYAKGGRVGGYFE